MRTPPNSTERDAARRYAPANISLHIERVVLDSGSFNSAHVAQIQTSLEQELTTLLRASGRPTQGSTEVAVHGGLPKSDAQSPAQLGRALARSVYASLHPSKGVQR